MLRGDLFDLHAAFGRANHRDPGLRAIEHHAEIELALDVEPCSTNTRRTSRLPGRSDA